MAEVQNHWKFEKVKDEKLSWLNLSLKKLWRRSKSGNSSRVMVVQIRTDQDEDTSSKKDAIATTPAY